MEISENLTENSVDIINDNQLYENKLQIYSDENKEGINIGIGIYKKYLKYGSSFILCIITISLFIATEVIKYFIFYTFGKADDLKNYTRKHFFLQLGILIFGIVVIGFSKYM